MGDVMVATNGIADFAQSQSHDIKDSPLGIGRNFLFQSSDSDTVLKGNLAIVRDDASVKELEECGLAGTVPPDQGNAFAPL
jgi:hypothetical protein